MRHPLNPGYRITTNFSSAHPGTDYAPPTPGQRGVSCHAPERSKVIASGTGTVEGNYVILQGLDTGKFYYFGHFAERRVSVNQSIGEGTVIGILGMTGKATGIHTHCEVRDARNSTFAGKHNPEAWFKSHLSTPQGGMPVADETLVNIIYGAFLGRAPDPGGMANYKGKPLDFVIKDVNNSQEHKSYWNSIQGNNKRIADLEAALRNEQNKPPKEVVKEVEKIVEKPIEVIKEVEIIKEVPTPVEVERFPKWVPGWLKGLLEAIFKRKEQ